MCCCNCALILAIEEAQRLNPSAASAVPAHDPDQGIISAPRRLCGWLLLSLKRMRTLH